MMSGGVSIWMGDLNNIPLIKQKHRTENTINANKCELSKVQILLACFMQNKNIILKAYYWVAKPSRNLGFISWVFLLFSVSGKFLPVTPLLSGGFVHRAF